MHEERGDKRRERREEEGERIEERRLKREKRDLIIVVYSGLVKWGFS